MNGGTGKAVPMLSGGKFTEVSCRYGSDVVEQPKDDTANVPAINRDVELRRRGKGQYTSKQLKRTKTSRFLETGEQGELREDR